MSGKAAFCHWQCDKRSVPFRRSSAVISMNKFQLRRFHKFTRSPRQHLQAGFSLWCQAYRPTIHKHRLKYNFSFIFCRLRFHTDPSQILFTEKKWNFFQSFQFLFSAKPPVMVRSGALVCRKIKLKKFPDPETAGGCGVAPFLSAKDLFLYHMTIPA